jgi:hypothetical protein
MMHRRTLGLAPLALLLALAGCGQELTAGGQKGDVDVDVTDDPGSPPAANPDLAPARGAPRLALRSALAPSGTVAVEGRVSLVTTDGRTIALPAGAGVVVTLSSTEEARLTRGSVSAVAYQAARITFTKLEANVTGGLSVGGVNLLGTVRVDLAQPLVIEAPIALTVRANGQHQVEIDLNAETWLLAANPVTRVVPAAALRGVVTVRAE